MTVKEYIDYLKEFPDDALVFGYDCEWGFLPIGVPVMEPEITIRYHFTNRPDEVFENVVVV